MPVSIAVEFAGLKFANPVLLAPGPSTNSEAEIMKGLEAGAAGFVAKTVASDSLKMLRKWPRPRFKLPDWERKKSSQKTYSLYSNEPAYRGTIDEYVRMLKSIKKKVKVPVIGSLFASRIEEWVDITKRLEQDAGCDAIELDVSCPHSPENLSEKELLEMILERVVKTVKVPVFVKLKPHDDIIDYVKISEDKGAKGLILCNRMSAIDVDINTRAPVMFGSYAGFGGSWAKYYVFKKLAEVAPCTKLPISATSGIASWEDIIKYTMLGATTMQVCTAIIVFGYDVIPRMLDGTRKFLGDNKISSLDKIRGSALKNILPVEKIERDPPIIAVLDKDKCTNCARCLKICFFGAISKGGKKIDINGKVCDGCGLCFEICPVEAISMKRIK